MGANAQTSVPAFTSGQVLTAQQQTEINTGIPVFATTTTRDAAFGGTGEKTLAEGQFAYIEASNTTQYYDGTAWQTVGGGLTLISTTTIGSAVSSVTVSSVFSSTYDNYKIIISGGASNTDVVIGTTLGSTSTGYYCAYTGATYAAASSSNFADNNASSWSRCVSSTTSGVMGMFDLIGPNLAKRTFIIGSQMDPAIGRFSAGYLNDTTQYTSITFTVSGGTQTGGTIRVYGYQNS